MKYAALIPAYNEVNNLPRLLDMLPLQKQDVVVVDDGSTDGTAEVAAHWGATVLKHARNKGKGAAQRTGFEYLRKKDYDGVITIDADCQHDPALIPRFLNSARDNKYDIVIGTRDLKTGTSMPLERLLTNLTTSLAVSLLSGQRITDSQSGYRFLSRRVIRNIDLETSRYQTESEILIKAGRRGYRIGEVPISTIYAGQKSNIKKDVDTLRFILLCIRSLWR